MLCIEHVVLMVAWCLRALTPIRLPNGLVKPYRTLPSNAPLPDGVNPYNSCILACLRIPLKASVMHVRQQHRAA
jgi:hypothetical protein